MILTDNDTPCSLSSSLVATGTISGSAVIIGGEVGLRNEGRGEVGTGGGVGGPSDSTDLILALVRRAMRGGG